MDERVYPVDPSHSQRMPKEETLDPELPEDAQSLLYPNQLESMSSGKINGVFLEGHGGKCTSKLICLYGKVGE